MAIRLSVKDVATHFASLSRRYGYADESSAAGSWIYRIMDSDSTDKRDMLCQCFVEVVTESESKSQGVSENLTKVTDVILSLLTILFFECGCLLSS